MMCAALGRRSGKKLLPLAQFQAKLIFAPEFAYANKQLIKREQSYNQRVFQFRGVPSFVMRLASYCIDCLIPLRLSY